MAALLGLVICAPASAQPRPGCQVVARNGPLTDAEVRQVEAWAAAQVPGLASSEPARVEASRDELLAPLDCPEIGVPFRIEFGKVISRELMRIVRGADEQAAICALQVAGEIASAQSLRILEAGTRDDRPAVRLAAARGYRDALRAAALEDDAFGGISGAKRSTVPGVGRWLAEEENPLVARTLVHALASTDPNEELHDASAQLIADGLSAQIERLGGGAEVPAGEGPAWAGTLLTGSQVVYETLIDVGRGTPIDPGLRRDGVATSREVLGFVGARVEMEGPDALTDSGEAASLKSLAQISVNIISLVERDGRAPDPPIDELFDDMIASGDSQPLLDAIDAWVNGTR